MTNTYTKEMTHQKRQRAPYRTALCYIGIVAFGSLSVFNGSTHVLPITEGSLIKALLFCAPFFILGFSLEYFMDKAGPRSHHVYGLFIRACGLYGGLGFVCGVTFDIYNPFPDWEVDWLAVTLTAQVALEMTFIHCCWNWVRDFRGEKFIPIENSFYLFFEDKKVNPAQEIKSFQDELDLNESEIEFLMFKNERAGRLPTVNYLLNVERELADELTNNEAEADLLAYKLNKQRSFEKNLSEVGQ